MTNIKQQIAHIENFFDGLRPKFKLAVRRVEPKWCAKHLGTIHIFEGEDLSFEAIRERFGGGKFYIKIKGKDGRYLGHRTITICGEPLEDWRPIHRKTKSVTSCPLPFSSIDNEKDKENSEIDPLRKLLDFVATVMEK